MKNLTAIDRFDNTFLYSILSVGLVTSFILIFAEELTGKVESIPFYLFGIFLPFYVGYMRGAIEYDSIHERIRGWIYFVIGTSSYFAFFILSKFTFPNIFKEFLYLVFVVFSLLISYRLYNWSKQVFNVDSVLSQYAFSGTAFCAVLIAYLSKATITRFSNYLSESTNWIIFKTSSELMFIILAIFAILSIILINEKASKNLLLSNKGLTDLKSPNIQLGFPLLKGLYLGLQLYEYTFKYVLESYFFWFQALIFGVLGSLFWMIRIQILSQIFLFFAILFSLIGILTFSKKQTIIFHNIKGIIPEKTLYIGLISLPMFLIFFTGSIRADILGIVFLTVYLFIFYKNR